MVAVWQLLAAADQLIQYHAKVLLVVHILPERDANEYQWMKSFCERYGLIRQGILLQNALSRFAGADWEVIVENVLRWIMRRLHEIVVATHREQSSLTLRIGPETIPQKYDLKMNGVEKAIQQVLSERVPVERKVSVSTVRIEGFPSTMNQFQLATVFADFIVKSVELSETHDCAMIEFATKFQAAQAAMLFNGCNVDSMHKLSVVPVHPEVLNHI
ncbi:unnamed protein product [Toxocara canis]|uniref:RRM domain-containing protein n=1 Tax=Toxocara canis TaxID=6265 RepID=A0A183UBV4_TOXCA|nr:unnamed protein product [Toxocara canis]